MSSMATSYNCSVCSSLVYKDETINGMGVRCGCAGKAYRKMKKALNLISESYRYDTEPGYVLPDGERCGWIAKRALLEIKRREL